ncbi:MAG: hypothetical protein ABF824_13135 [Acetobacter sp.]
MTDSFYTMIDRACALPAIIRVAVKAAVCVVLFSGMIAGVLTPDPVVSGHAYAVEAVR